MEIKKSLSADLEGKKGTGLLMGFVLALSAMFVAFEWTQHDKKVIETEPVFTAAIEEDMIPITQQPEVVAPPPAAAPKIAEIINIVDNAIKYNRPGGRVDITVTPEGGAVVLTVSDTGVGIPKDSQSRIFERFYRVDKSRSKAVGGTGLGLSIVKHAALIQKADVRVESEPGEGSAFTVTFPEK